MFGEALEWAEQVAHGQHPSLHLQLTLKGHLAEMELPQHPQSACCETSGPFNTTTAGGKETNTPLSDCSAVKGVDILMCQRCWQ